MIDDDIAGWTLVSILVGIFGLIIGDQSFIGVIGFGSALILSMRILTDIQERRKNGK